MKHISIDELLHFDFHDAVIESIAFTDTEMAWVVSAVNALPANTQNHHDVAMCIEKATITFENPNIESMTFAAFAVHHSNGKIESHETVKVKESERIEILKKTTESNHIHGMEGFSATDDNQLQACFNIDSYADGFYYLDMKFAKVTVAWENYSGKAWYETDEWKKRVEERKS